MKFISNIKVCVSCSVASDSVTLCSVGHQFPLSTGFPGQEYRNGSPYPSPGDLPNPGIEPCFKMGFIPTLQVWNMYGSITNPPH